MDLSPTQIEEFGKIVGHDFFSTDPIVQDRLARTTLPEEGSRPLGIIRPANREQVQQIVRLAAAHKTPLYPISTGKNWGYGDACAPLEGCLILDLSRMNRILEVNSKLAYAVVEPGVTQGQLSNYLRQNKIPLIMDCTGAGPETSLMGNALDRGFGHSPYGDRFGNSCNYEVVLSDGSLLSTGFGAYPNAQAQHVYKWGVGPSIDGLFTQSNLGIVTRLTLWLMPQPESLEYFFITLKTPEAISGLVEVLRQLRLQGMVRSTVHCLNERRLVASRAQYPWDQADGKQALEKQHPELLDKLCRQYGIPAWAALGVVMGSRVMTAAARRSIQKGLKGLPGLDRVLFLTEKQFTWLNRGASVMKWIIPNHPLLKSLGEARVGMDMLTGTPSFDTLKGAHWRARKEPGPAQDALDSGSGLIWISPVLPMMGESVSDLTRLAEPLFHQFGFEYQVTLSLTTERALSAIMSICFDKSSREESARAKACSEKLMDVLMNAGYVPYRGSPAILASIRKYSPAFWTAAAKLKQTWDPDGLIAPGRYIPDQKSKRTSA